MKTIYLGLGSNLGEKHKNIKKAILLLKNHPQITITKTSSLITSKAVSKTKQPDFLNSALICKTSLKIRNFFQLTKTIEKQLGRISKKDYAPRTIDIDILFIDDKIICESDLTIPHPLIHEREFVLKPLIEIAPDFIHPILSKSIKELYKAYKEVN